LIVSIAPLHNFDLANNGRAASLIASSFNSFICYQQQQGERGNGGPTRTNGVSACCVLQLSVPWLPPDEGNLAETRDAEKTPKGTMKNKSVFLFQI